MDLDRGRLRAAGEVAATDSEVSEPCPGLLCLGEAPSLPNPQLLCMKRGQNNWALKMLATLARPERCDERGKCF